MKYFVIILALLSFESFAEEKLTDPAMEMRAINLFRNIKCVVCKAQAIDESNADMAQNMRALVRHKIKQGENDEDIKSYLTSRYGEQILFSPPFKPSTLLLWFGPFIGILIGLYSIYRLT